MQSVNNASTPSPAFNVAGPNKRTIAEGAWNVGTVNAVNPNQLAVVSDTLDIITGPTIGVTQGTHPFFANANTAVPTPAARDLFILNGANTANPSLSVYAYATSGSGGRPLFSGYSANGTPGTLTVTENADRLVEIQGFGYTGSAYAGESSGLIFLQAIENFTTAANGADWIVQTVKGGTTTQGQVAAFLNSGEVAIGASLTSPNLSSGSGVPSATEPKGSIFMRTDGSIGANVYISNGSGTWTAIALA